MGGAVVVVAGGGGADVARDDRPGSRVSSTTSGRSILDWPRTEFIFYDNDLRSIIDIRFYETLSTLFLIKRLHFSFNWTLSRKESKPISLVL